jgi:hypothetical protein
MKGLSIDDQLKEFVQSVSDSVHSVYIVFPITRLRSFMIKMVWQLILLFDGQYEIKSKKPGADITDIYKHIKSCMTNYYGESQGLYSTYYANFFKDYEFKKLTKANFGKL